MSEKNRVEEKLAKEDLLIENKQDSQEVEKTTTKMKKSKKRSSGLSYLIELLIKIAITVVLIWGLLTFVIGVYINTNNSSYPMIKDGDLCITYKLDNVIKGDVVAYKVDGKIRFGRVIAGEGEEVDIRDGVVLVDGYNVVEDTIYETSEEGDISFPYTVKKGEFFILNDFRADNKDSRIYGGISKKDIKGKLIFLMRRRGF